MTYNETLDADDQITAEEMIASTIFDYQRNQIDMDSADGIKDHTLTEEDCQTLGKLILERVLEKFCPEFTV